MMLHGCYATIVFSSQVVSMVTEIWKQNCNTPHMVLTISELITYSMPESRSDNVHGCYATTVVHVVSMVPNMALTLQQSMVAMQQWCYKWFPWWRKYGIDIAILYGCYATIMLHVVFMATGSRLCMVLTTILDQFTNKSIPTNATTHNLRVSKWHFRFM